MEMGYCTDLPRPIQGIYIDCLERNILLTSSKSFVLRLVRYFFLMRLSFLCTFFLLPAAIRTAPLTTAHVRCVMNTCASCVWGAWTTKVLLRWSLWWIFGVIRARYYFSYAKGFSTGVELSGKRKTVTWPSSEEDVEPDITLRLELRQVRTAWCELGCDGLYIRHA